MCFQKLFLNIPNAEDYTRIPLAHDVSDVLKTHATFVNNVVQLLHKHDVADKFALFAAHKHFEVPADHALKLSHVRFPRGDIGELVYPVAKVVVQELQPVAFYITGGTLKPYKFSDVPGNFHDVSDFPIFLHEFMELIKRYVAGTYFGLKVLPSTPVAQCKCEIPEFLATITVPPQYFDLIDDGLPTHHEESDSKNQKHAKTVKETHRVFVRPHGPEPSPGGVFEAVEAMILGERKASEAKLQVA